jgi:hypothetical protein
LRLSVSIIIDSNAIQYNIIFQSRVEFNSPYIVPACLYDGSEALNPADNGIASGWGSTFSGGSVVQVLRDVKLPLTANATCSSFYGTSYDVNTMICFGIQGDNKDTCQV